jgi:hypothetical protein
MSSTPHSLEGADLKAMDSTKQIEVSGDFTWTPEEEKKLVKKAHVLAFVHGPHKVRHQCHSHVLQLLTRL